MARGHHNCSWVANYVKLDSLNATRANLSHEVTMTSQSTIGNPDLVQIFAKASDAANGGVSGLSTGEALVAALVLNRSDWLASMNYTIVEALERIGPDWVRLIPAAARQFSRETEEAAAAAADKAQQDKLAQFSAQQGAEVEELDFSTTFVTSAKAPGYRDVSLTFDLKAIGAGPRATIRASIRVNPRDGEAVVGEIIAAHRFAWARRRPIDAGPEEDRPAWIGTP
jgi:hypothetical protein